MKRIALLSGIVFAACLVLFLQPFQRGDGRLLWLTGAPASSALLEAAGLPKTATEITDVAFNDVDGTLPEMSRVGFAAPMSETALRRFYLGKCAGLGLEEASEDVLASAPTSICTGRIQGARASLSLSTRCTTFSCQAELIAAVL